MQIALLVFDRITVLDIVGPYEVLSRLPGADVRFVAPDPGEVSSEDRALTMVARHSLADVARPDVVVVPGGQGNRTLMTDDRTLGWLRDVHAHSRYTTSVCTGSLVLGAAGILQGLRATTHWLYMDMLAKLGAHATGERVVEEGRVITAAGVSSGIDMALLLAERAFDRRTAEAIQLAIEYDPQPHVDAGSPEKASAEVVELVRERGA